jgi:hypothetical protein
MKVRIIAQLANMRVAVKMTIIVVMRRSDYESVEFQT